jgi:hypothetical protein
MVLTSAKGSRNWYTPEGLVHRVSELKGSSRSLNDAAAIVCTRGFSFGRARVKGSRQPSILRDSHKMGKDTFWITSAWILYQRE